MHHLEEAARLRQQGHRLTPQRMQVLQVIKAQCTHHTAEEIHAAIVPDQPYLDIATVYRTLQWLQGVGLVAPITIDGRLYYEYHAHGDQHHHLICQQCSQHIQIPDADMATLRAEILQRYGFMLQVDHLALSGLCAACAAPAEQDAADE
jgi:Fur family transcriptional regulator, ferric uptake regulator